mmetsp:Transcript_10229/g.17159  ORF Transcript_10229/g.17159 Transcript_10229/m.17159 type:complete len:110 (-) Transcript_10229:234-563(-)
MRNNNRNSNTTTNTNTTNINMSSNDRQCIQRNSSPIAVTTLRTSNSFLEESWCYHHHHRMILLLLLLLRQLDSWTDVMGIVKKSETMWVMSKMATTEVTVFDLKCESSS